MMARNIIIICGTIKAVTAAAERSSVSVSVAVYCVKASYPFFNFIFLEICNGSWAVNLRNSGL